MSTRTRRAPLNLPLVNNPIERNYVVTGPQSEIRVNITACPESQVRYQVQWVRRPPAGTNALCSGQVMLMRKAAGKAADLLATIRAESNGSIYAGLSVNSPTHSYYYQQLKVFQLHDVDDFEFSGRISEQA